MASRRQSADQQKPVEIWVIASAIKADADESRSRQMKAMASQKWRMVASNGEQPSPWQENAIRIMEDWRE